MSDQERISPYDIITISTREVMRIKKNINFGDNSLIQYYKNCIVDSLENYKFDLGVKGLTAFGQYHKLRLYEVRW